MSRFACKETTVRAKRTKITARQDNRVKHTESASCSQHWQDICSDCGIHHSVPASCDSLYAETEIWLLINLT